MFTITRRRETMMVNPRMASLKAQTRRIVVMIKSLSVIEIVDYVTQRTIGNLIVLISVSVNHLSKKISQAKLPRSMPM